MEIQMTAMAAMRAAGGNPFVATASLKLAKRATMAIQTMEMRACRPVSAPVAAMALCKAGWKSVTMETP